MEWHLRANRAISKSLVNGVVTRSQPWKNLKRTKGIFSMRRSLPRWARTIWGGVLSLEARTRALRINAVLSDGPSLPEAVARDSNGPWRDVALYTVKFVVEEPQKMLVSRTAMLARRCIGRIMSSGRGKEFMYPWRWKMFDGASTELLREWMG